MLGYQVRQLARQVPLSQPFPPISSLARRWPRRARRLLARARLNQAKLYLFKTWAYYLNQSRSTSYSLNRTQTSYFFTSFFIKVKNRGEK